MSDALTFVSGFAFGGFLVGVIVWQLALAGFRNVLSEMVRRRRFEYEGRLFHLQLVKRL